MEIFKLNNSKNIELIKDERQKKRNKSEKIQYFSIYSDISTNILENLNLSQKDFEPESNPKIKIKYKIRSDLHIDAQTLDINFFDTEFKNYFSRGRTDLFNDVTRQDYSKNRILTEIKFFFSNRDFDGSILILSAVGGGLEERNGKNYGYITLSTKNNRNERLYY